MWPSRLVWENYPAALSYVPFLLYFRDTLYITFFNVVATVISCAIVAYGFSYIEWPGRNTLFFLLSTMSRSFRPIYAEGQAVTFRLEVTAVAGRKRVGERAERVGEPLARCRAEQGMPLARRLPALHRLSQGKQFTEMAAVIGVSCRSVPGWGRDAVRVAWPES